MAESVDIILSANDQASAKLATASANIDKFGKTAKAGGKAIGQFNTILGQTPFGSFAGGLANMAGELVEVKNQMQGAANTSILFKGALVATAGVIGFQIGNAIRGMVDELTGLNDALEETLRKTNELASADQRRLARRDKNKQQDFGDIEDPEERLAAQREYLRQLDKEIEATKENVRVKQEAVDASDKWYRIDETKKEVAMLQAEADAERAKLEVLRQQAEAVRDATSQREQDRIRAKEEAETKKRIDAENRKRADEMWKREAEEHGKQLERQKNAADGARRLQEELQQRLRAIRDDGNAKRKESEREAFLEMMEWEMEQEEKYIDQSNKQFRKRQEQDKKDRDAANVSLNAFESRLLSRGGGIQPIDRIVKNTEQTNKELAEQRRIQQQQLEELRRSNGGVEFGTIGG